MERGLKPVWRGRNRRGDIDMETTLLQGERRYVFAITRRSAVPAFVLIITHGAANRPAGSSNAELAEIVWETVAPALSTNVAGVSVLPCDGLTLNVTDAAPETALTITIAPALPAMENPVVVAVPTVIGVAMPYKSMPREIVVGM
jgi:hypothetical protein